MIEAILPDAVEVAEAREDPHEVALFPAEEALIAAAVEKRRREFATSRDCAHRALKKLGARPGPVQAGRRGEPLWPSGVVGSITHCTGYRGCAVADRAVLATIGIDAEPHAPLPSGLLADVAGREERAALSALAREEPSLRWERILFSAKEAVYKAWYPLTERWLGFEDARLSFEPERRRFQAQFLVRGPLLGGVELAAFDGQWLVEDGLVLTAVAVRT